ncbi:iron-sulfur cluster carrier protein ApbC [Sansalvadorimonas verongulae]|uniref:iron-sulfur cluster carrier protein ApbC n=1 Tax=Sansalvadorimonas verongulae TaxID=2172824 RepID=UPI0012BB4FE2|nr:iron-sulfur cluster carrier protein ApbC [Sansalvadorimonas verongulae]MTI12930.1 iron-sulfur cluster carrier protein ApbC [Sansalvadorimonas verongulae]
MTVYSQEPIAREMVEAVLRNLQDPWLKDSLLQVVELDNINVENGNAILDIAVLYPCAGVHDQLEKLIADELIQYDAVNKVSVSFSTRIPAAPRTAEDASLNSVKNIIAVGSGKGGVGKSTTSVNLALALAADGAKVGILDADIYGPSIGQMLGVDDDVRPDVHEAGGKQFFVPIEAHGLKSNSMAYLVTEQTPMVWRGPMASGALMQLLNQTMWGELDYLIVDMPPGTGDIQLTLSQKAPLAGSVIVTTPQDLALLDARKGIEMFNKVNVPVLGVVENMAVHVCSQCGHAEHLFGEGGGSRMADEYCTQLLGALPLSLSIRQHADAGMPTVVAYSEKDSAEARLYRDTARRTAALLAVENNQSAPIPTITISED